MRLLPMRLASIVLATLLAPAALHAEVWTLDRAFTGFCPPEILLRKLGVPSRGCGCAAPKDRQAP